MKRFFIILCVVGAFVTMSCENENSENPQPLGNAKVSGVVYADLDETNNDGDIVYEKVANKKYIVTAWAYDPHTDNEHEYILTEGTTDANGNYSFEVPVGNREIEIEVNFADFRHTVTTEDGPEERVIYGWDFQFNDNDGWDDDFYVSKGGEYIRDFYYNIAF